MKYKENLVYCLSKFVNIAIDKSVEVYKMLNEAEFKNKMKRKQKRVCDKKEEFSEP